MRRSVAFLTLLRIRFWTANKKKIFLDGLRATRSTIKKKRWGSGDENEKDYVSRGTCAVESVC